MSEVRPWLATPTPVFAKAYPQIKALEIDVVQDSGGWYASKEWQRTSKYNEGNIRNEIHCVNQRCERGGLNLDRILYALTIEGTTEVSLVDCCSGDEGSPKGRKRGESCMNTFNVTIKITYHEKP